MKIFKLTAVQVSEKYFGDDVDLEMMQDEAKKYIAILEKSNKILSSEVTDKLIAITYEALPMPIYNP